MRAFTVAVIWALVVEIILGLAFLAGFHWIGGWQMGMLTAGAMLLLLTLPWLGELTARYDSATGSVRATVGWWGRVSLSGKLAPILEVRICGIPWRKKLGVKKPEDDSSPPAPLRPDASVSTERGMTETADDTSADSSKPARSRPKVQVDHENIDDITRAVTAALAAGNDMLWDARELYFRIDAPTENNSYDDVIARVWAHRGVGPVDVKVTRGDGKRRIRARYAIGLFRAGATALCMAAQGRVWTLGKALRKRTPDKDAEVSDEQLITDLTAKSKEGDGDGV